MKSKQKGIVLAIIAAFLWGIMGIFVRVARDSIGPLEISFFRCIITGLVFLAFLAVTKPSALHVSGKGLLICVLYGAVAYSLSFTTYSLSVTRLPVAVATILMYLSPVWVTLLSVIVFHDKPSKNGILAIVICLAGAVLSADLLSMGQVRLDPLGILMGIINGFGMALQILIPRYFADRYSKDTMLVYGFLGAALVLGFFLGILMGIINGFGMALQILIPRYFADRYSKDTMLVYGFLGAALVLGFFVDFGQIGAALTADSRLEFLGAILMLSVLCTMVANISYVKSSDYITASESSILGALEVVVGSLAGFLVYHEQLKLLQFLGMVLVIGGAIISQMPEKPLARRH